MRDQIRGFSDSQARKQQMNYFTDVYWAEIYSAVAFGVISSSAASTVDAKTASANDMNAFLSTYKTALKDKRCEGIEAWIASH